jgi:hypothetical protein
MSSARFTTRRDKAVAFTAAAAVSVSALLVAPAAASADEPVLSDGYLSDQTVAQALEDVESHDDALVAEPSVYATATDVQVSDDPTRGVVLAGESGPSLSVGLPFADEAEEAVTQDDGTVIYPGQGSANVVVPTVVGAQMLTVIADESAPTRYSYAIDLAAGQRLELTGGGAEVVNADGTTAHLISAPWAKDANGQQVATHFEVEGDSLVQVIDHTDAASVAYPVVADPIFLPYFVVRCLMGIGLNGPQIARIAERGTLSAILAAGGWAAVRCVMGR